MKIFKFQTKKLMVSALASKCEATLENAIQERGHACWAVSGGSTPLPLFAEISQADIVWSAVNIALVDERWVPEAHARSNTSFVKKNLLQGRASTAIFAAIKEDDAALCSASYANENYAKLALPFDSVLLGMGGDGHTASLFPDADGLEEAFAVDNDDICAVVAAKKSEVTGDETDRVTLTAAEICRARQIILMITGEDKFKVFQRALSGDDSLPIGRLIRMAPDKFEIYWSP